jgi:DNA-binding PadR family transcriptional regulator
MIQLDQECGELLIHVASVAHGDGAASTKGLSMPAIRKLVEHGLLEFRTGSRKSHEKPTIVTITEAGRRLAKRLRNEQPPGESTEP